MKRFISAVGAMMLVMLCLVGCGKQNSGGTTTGERAPKLGLGIVAVSEGKDAASDKNGSAETTSYAVAVLLGSDGKIADVRVDAVACKVEFDATGAVKNRGENFKTKRELGDDYGMKSASGIGKEWYEQADALEKYVVGKSKREVETIAVDEDGTPTDSSLASGCTISIADFKDAVVKACDNATELGSKSGDKLSLAAVAKETESADAKADSDGKCVSEAVFTAVTVSSDGKITASVIDSVKSETKIDKSGKVTTERDSHTIKTKRELGDDYGMKSASDIGKEWFEQADAFSKYLVGRNASGIDSIKVDEYGAAEDDALKASCTISVGNFTAVTEKALELAK